MIGGRNVKQVHRLALREDVCYNYCADPGLGDGRRHFRYFGTNTFDNIDCCT